VFYTSAAAFTSTGSDCGTNCHFLEFAPAGWITSSSPAGQTNCATAGTSTADPACHWSGNTSTLIGSLAQGTAIGSGYANTSAIIAQTGGGSTAGKAATVSRAYQGGGKTDWYLPSTNEQNEMCKYVNTQTTGNTATMCTTTGAVQRTGLGFVFAQRYWSSTEFDNLYSWWQNFGTTLQTYLQKTNTFYVRPVRAG
jgi:hypothetical protein